MVSPKDTLSKFADDTKLMVQLIQQEEGTPSRDLGRLEKQTHVN